MKKLLLISLFLLLCLYSAPFLLGRVHAAALKFDKPSATINAGDTIDVQIVIDPGTEQVTSTDAWILFDKNVLTVTNVKDGTYFPTVTNETSNPGKVYVAGLVNDPTQYKTGTGVVATVTFRALASGVANLTYECSPTATETSKVIKNDVNSTNIIDCASNGTEAITVSSTRTGTGTGGGGTGGATPTPAPTATPFVTSTPIPTPTVFVQQLPLTSSSSATPSALPQSGVIENIMNIAVPGIFLLAIGGVIKIMLGI